MFLIEVFKEANLWTLIVLILIILIICYVAIFCKIRNRYRGGGGRDSPLPPPPPVFNPGECPICLWPPILGIITNCGHLYCGKCFIRYHIFNYAGRLLSCPLCRMRIRRLYDCFTHEEQVNPQNFDAVRDIRSIIWHYNQTMTTRVTIRTCIQGCLRYLALRLVQAEIVLRVSLFIRLITYFIFIFIFFVFKDVPQYVHDIDRFIDMEVFVLLALFYITREYRNMIIDQEI